MKMKRVAGEIGGTVCMLMLSNEFIFTKWILLLLVFEIEFETRCQMKSDSGA